LILRSKFFAGQYARWLALTSPVLIEPSRALGTILSMLQELETFDFIDQVEILCSGELLTGQPANRTYKGLVQKKLSTLPAAVAKQLTSLSVLPAYSSEEQLF